MLDRESSFADAKIAELLTTSYVPVALDVWYEERREDAAGELYRKIVFQREGTSPDHTTQGFYVCAPDGKLLEGWNHRDPDRMRQKLEQMLASYHPPTLADDAATPAANDSRFARSPPEGGLVLRVRSRIVRADWPAATKDANDEWTEIFHRATGDDHLWITKDEVDALLGGEFPDRLTRRIARFHLIDNTRGEPPMWSGDEVRSATLKSTPAKEGRAIEGRVALRSHDGDRGYDAALRGVVECAKGQVTRLDLVARGEFFGQGTYTQGAPPGTFTLAIAFTLARDEVDRLVPPQGARELHDYLEP